MKQARLDGFGALGGGEGEFAGAAVNSCVWRLQVDGAKLGQLSIAEEQQALDIVARMEAAAGWQVGWAWAHGWVGGGGGEGWPACMLRGLRSEGRHQLLSEQTFCAAKQPLSVHTFCAAAKHPLPPPPLPPPPPPQNQ